MLPIGILLIILCFYLLGSTADAYLSPALETIAVKLNISESVAGVTFLAFGNGAPDVISALSASGGDDGIYLAISALLGAGLFVACIVAAVVILSAPKPIQVLPKVFLRDTGFYMLGPVILTIAAFTGKISLPFDIVFLVVYAIFVIIVFVSERFGDSHQNDTSLVKTDTLRITQTLDSEYRQNSESEENKALIQNTSKSESRKLLDNVSEESASAITDGEYKIVEQHFIPDDDHGINTEPDSFSEDVKEVSGVATSITNTKNKFVWSMVKMKFFLKKAVKSENPWQDMNWFQKLVYIFIDAPFDFLRRLTIPPGNDEQWDRRFASAFPPLAVTFFF